MKYVLDNFQNDFFNSIEVLFNLSVLWTQYLRKYTHTHTHVLGKQVQLAVLAR